MIMIKKDSMNTRNQTKKKIHLVQEINRSKRFISYKKSNEKKIHCVKEINRPKRFINYKKSWCEKDSG